MVTSSLPMAYQRALHHDAPHSRHSKNWMLRLVRIRDHSETCWHSPSGTSGYFPNGRPFCRTPSGLLGRGDGCSVRLLSGEAGTPRAGSGLQTLGHDWGAGALGLSKSLPLSSLIATSETVEQRRRDARVGAGVAAASVAHGVSRWAPLGEKKPWRYDLWVWFRAAFNRWILWRTPLTGTSRGVTRSVSGLC